MRKKKVEVIDSRNPKVTLDDLLIFDVRGIDKDTQTQLIRLFPEMSYVRFLWKEIFDELGCLHCGRKKTRYYAGGFCYQCSHHIASKLKRKYHQKRQGRQLPEDFAAALTLASDAAQKLLGGG